LRKVAHGKRWIAETGLEPSSGLFGDRPGRPGALTRRAALVGVVPGLAGSAALVLLALSTIDSLWTGMAYIALFGLGTIAGMGLLSCLLAMPLRLLAGRLSLHYSCALALLGLWSIGLGGVLLYENASAVFH